MLSDDSPKGDRQALPEALRLNEKSGTNLLNQTRTTTDIVGKVLKLAGGGRVDRTPIFSGSSDES